MRRELLGVSYPLPPILKIGDGAIKTVKNIGFDYRQAIEDRMLRGTIMTVKRNWPRKLE